MWTDALFKEWIYVSNLFIMFELVIYFNTLLSQMCEDTQILDPYYIAVQWHIACSAAQNTLTYSDNQHLSRKKKNLLVT